MVFAVFEGFEVLFEIGIRGPGLARDKAGYIPVVHSAGIDCGRVLEPLFKPLRHDQGIIDLAQGSIAL